jgi:hypothetical protein
MECIYTPHSQSQLLSANLAFFVLTGRAGRCDQTCPVGGNSRFWNQGRWVTGCANESDQGWPDASDRSKPYLEPLCYFFTVDRTHRSRDRSVTHRVRSLTLAVITADNATCASGHELTSVRSIKRFAVAVQYTDRTRSVKRKDRVRSSYKVTNHCGTRRDLNETCFKLSLGFTWAT